MNSSLRDLFKDMDKIEKELLKAGAKGLENGMFIIAKQSLKEAPLDEGDLRESFVGEVNGKQIMGGSKSGIPIKSGSVKEKAELKVEMGYDTEYALIQHENMSFKHPTPGTKAKYLSDPLQQNEGKFMKAITKEIEKVIK